MAWLSMLLFLLWFCVLSALYWHFPRQPRNTARRQFDSSALALAFMVSISTMHWGYATAKSWAGSGPLWQHIMAVLYAYGGFLAVITLALCLRLRCLR